MKNILFSIFGLLLCLNVYSQRQLLQVSTGDSVILILENTNNIQWQTSVNSTTWTSIPGEVTSILRLLPSQDAYYRAEIKGLSCGTIYSDTVFIPVLLKAKTTLNSAELTNLLKQCYVGQYFWYSKEWALNFTEGGTDIYTYGYDNRIPDLLKYNSNTSSYMTYLGGLWNVLYKSVMNCNALIHFTQSSNLGASEKDQITAEACFLRANYLWKIVETWGGTVFVKGFEPLKAGDWKIAPVDTFYNQIISDLTFARDHLPSTILTNTLLNRSIAEAFLARMYLTNKDYYNALQFAKVVINSFKYNLLPSFSDIWELNNRQNKEVVYALDFTGTDLANYYVDFTTFDNTGTAATYIGNNAHLFWGMKYDIRPGLTRTIEYGRPFTRFFPTRFFLELFNDNLDQRFEGSFRTSWICNNSANIPKWQSSVYINNISTSIDAAKVGANRFQIGDTALLLVKNYGETKAYLKAGQSPGDAIHPTRGYSIMDFSDLYNIDGSPSTFSGRYYFYPLMKKFEDKTRLNIVDMNSTRNAYIIRYAEVLLIAAEAAFATGQKDEAYTFLLNLANARAKNGNGTQLLSSYGINSAADITLDFILDERARELAGEQLRWFDLKRTGKLVERVMLHNTDGALNIQNYHNLRPIPIEFVQPEFQSQVLQNPGY